jgi:hypothetical protein
VSRFVIDDVPVLDVANCAGPFDQQVVSGLDLPHVLEEGAGRREIVEGEELLERVRIQAPCDGSVGNDRFDLGPEANAVGPNCIEQRLDPDAIPDKP